MCHLWQYRLGKPARKSYHDRQWADRMESIGLMPSSTGKPGGARTGQHMADYPLEGGKFLEVASKLIDGPFRLAWYDRADEILAEQQAGALGSMLAALPPCDVGQPAVKANRSKLRFACPQSGCN
jgi:hypothetical protein